MLGRRLLVLLVVLMGLTVLASSVAPRREAAPVQPAPSSTRAADAPPRRASEERVSAERGRPPARIVVRQGDLLTLVVSSPARGAIALERVEARDGLDFLDAVDPVSPARFELLADRPGSYRILVVETDREIGTIEVRPR